MILNKRGSVTIQH